MEESSNELVQIFDKPGAKAFIWQYFGVTDVNERTSAAVCKLCKEVVPRKGGTTSCIWSHLKVHHNFEYKALKALQYKRLDSDTIMESASTSKIVKASLDQDSVETTSEKFVLQLYSKSSDKWKTLTDYVTNSIAHVHLPVDVIEKEEFKQLLQKFDPRYKLPDITYFTHVALPSLHADFKKVIANELKNISFVAVAVDKLVGANNSAYLSIVCHFIIPEWEMQSRALETAYMPCSIDGSIKQDIRATVEDVLDAWCVAEKVVAITTKREIFENYNFKWPAILCFGDAIFDKKISTVVRNNNQINQVCDVADSVFYSFSHGHGKQALEESQSRLGLPKHQLKVECSTPWRSLYLSFERLLEQKQAIEEVLSSNKNFPQCEPILLIFDVIIDVCSVLKPLSDIADALSEEKYVSLSTVLPLLKLISEVLAQDDADREVAAKLKRSLQDGLHLSFGEIQKFLHKATLLDPRYKDSVPADALPQLKRELQAEALDISSSTVRAKKKIKSIQPPPRKKVALAKLLCGIRGNVDVQSTADLSVTDKIKKEIDSYLDETLVYAGADPLEWWRNRQASYRYLSNLAKKYLCCCATCCTTEKLFHRKAGHVDIPPSSSQFPDGVNILTFLSQNL